MYRKKLLFIPLLFLIIGAQSQDRWSLRKCVDYARQNNISVKQMQLQAEQSDINYKQSVLSKFPSLNFSNTDGFRYGKSQNPSTGILENQNYFSIGLNLQTNAEIFNFFSKKNTILANKWSLEAAKASVDKAQNDISLTVANAYLQILLANEQQEIADVQVKQSISQLDLIKKQVKAGALPELNATEIESQLATDSSNLISAIGNVKQTKYILKSYLNLDAGLPFEIEEPKVDQIPVEDIGDLQPESVYTSALANQPQQRVNDFNLKAAEKNALAAKGALYPSVSAFGSLGSNYGYFKTPVFEQVLSGYSSSGLVISDGQGGYVDVQRPVFVNGAKSGYIKSQGLGDQFSNNFGQQVGLSISVPIFNGGQAKAVYQRSKLAIKNIEYQKDLDNKTLKQDIYQAYNSAAVALEKFTSSRRAVESAQKSFDFATKRYNVGMLSTLDLITTQNNLLRSKLEYVSNHFDYVFRMKVLEFYRGIELKL
ncbi:MAG: TolC family protein [Ginsengibacter sp.]